VTGDGIGYQGARPGFGHHAVRAEAGTLPEWHSLADAVSGRQIGFARIVSGMYANAT
jgi:hypothetical protein